MRHGYCFLLTQDNPKFPVTWHGYSSPDDLWEIEVYKPTGTERLVGSRTIDGSIHRVFLCEDGQYRAQVLPFVRMT